MRERISAIIIDPKCDEHDYEQVNIVDNHKYWKQEVEKGFDLHVIKGTSNILSEINKFRGFDCLITVGENIDMAPLNALSYEFRKKWIHMDSFNPAMMAHYIVTVFLNNINRERPQSCTLFSFFTCTFNTSKDMFERAYKSLCDQTYKNWNWYILDDSRTPTTSEMIEKYHDPRIVLVKNVTNHGSIGFNKHLIASICDGDYLIEMDHDDEVTPDCLEYLMRAIEKYPDSDFLYSYAIEHLGDRLVDYGNFFAYGQGGYVDTAVGGKWGVMSHVAITPPVNAQSVRGIHALPNHLRCWKREFYHMIGGHNGELSVMDDMDILVRTFLKGKMTMIDRVLYIQHEDGGADRRRGSNTQSHRFDEIQRMNILLRMKYDSQIHERVLELGAIDPFWINDAVGSDIFAKYDPDDLTTLCNIYETGSTVKVWKR